ncbi:cytochrome P450 2G1-like [Synchiropus splendidus]|uniref:cytochrome P450 2G1-like n=1 Tax=Synchiropus splendidus TaxID=270530 RepID=UPI00237DC685|nr:cytochrome P450 2G1-like [Synchiropus splendidus]
MELSSGLVPGLLFLILLWLYKLKSRRTPGAPSDRKPAAAGQEDSFQDFRSGQSFFWSCALIIRNFPAKCRDINVIKPGVKSGEAGPLLRVFNLFLAGTETTSSTIRYALNVLIKYPKIQGELAEEFDSVVGRQRSPSMEDRKSLPFTDAVIHEIQRMMDIVPFGLPHYALKDISFRGFNIPKCIFIFALLHSVLKSEKIWESPMDFNPQHFLDHKGNFKNDEDDDE